MHEEVQYKRNTDAIRLECLVLQNAFIHFFRQP
nr:MAG TPA: hypothetical protein [Caudoviricetes sp.]